MNKIARYINGCCDDLLQAVRHIPTDYLLHGIVSFFVTIVLFSLMQMFMMKLCAFFLAGIVTISFGILKEIFDDYLGGQADIDDIIADLFGIASALFTIVILN